ncbi:MAG: hypothetical protein CL908_19030 [Deltaproteobacteria bacterium]|nr:hypothetical protein [Deltaproteobacteria bacterium]
MSFRIFDRLRPGRSQRASPPTREAATRARRARDHLEHKREHERQRLERERNRTHRAEHRARMQRVLAPTLFGLAVVFGIASATSFSERLLLGRTPLERVAVQGALALSPESIAREAGVLAGGALGRIDPDRVSRAVAAEPWIESARTLRLPTGTLVISVVERRAIARFRQDDSSDTLLVDDRGQRFAGAIEPGGPLPLVQGPEVGGKALSEQAREILGALRRHALFGADPSALTLILPGEQPAPHSTPPDPNSGFVLQIGEEGPRALLGRRLLSQRVARLAALLDEEAATVEGTHWIDLRYADRAVLRTEPASG